MEPNELDRIFLATAKNVAQYGPVMEYLGFYLNPCSVPHTFVAFLWIWIRSNLDETRRKFLLLCPLNIEKLGIQSIKELDFFKWLLFLSHLNAINFDEYTLNELRANCYTYLVCKAVEDLKTAAALPSWGRQIVHEIVKQPWWTLTHLHQLAHPKK